MSTERFNALNRNDRKTPAQDLCCAKTEVCSGHSFEVVHKS
jgi:hypothetical protein